MKSSYNRLEAWIFAYVLFGTLFANTAVEINRQEQPSWNESLQVMVARLAVSDTVVLSQASCGYLQFADNWAAHLTRIGVSNFVIVADDQVALDYLGGRLPGHVLPASLITNKPMPVSTTLREFSTDAFAKVSCMRPMYLQAFTELGVRVLWLDLDVAMLTNPFKLFPQGVEYVGVDDSDSLDMEQESVNICTCLILVRPTKTVKELLEIWASRCSNSTTTNQAEWNAVFTPRARSSVSFYIMPQRVFPNGHFADHWKLDHGAAWLHANWRKGHETKRDFFAKRKAWHAQRTESYPTCDD